MSDRRPWAPERVVDATLAARSIAAQFPEVDTREVTLLGEGWDNTVYLVGGRWVFRFPRREQAVELLEHEARVLPRIAGALPLAIPEPCWLGRPSGEFPWPFVGYAVLAGRAASEVRLTAAARAAAAPILGNFLRVLHAIPHDGLDAPPDRIGRLDLGPKIDTLLQRLDALAAAGVIRHTAPWRALVAEVPPVGSAHVLVHGDLYARHLLVDDAERVAAVIDWGDVHVGDPAVDLSVAWSFLSPRDRPAFRAAYGAIDERNWRLARVRAIWHTTVVTLYAHERGDTPLVAEGRRGLANVLRD
jgi:aminoglycoside phosphotransferase (APT) family kinase protein